MADIFLGLWIVFVTIGAVGGCFIVYGAIKAALEDEDD